MRTILIAITAALVGVNPICAASALAQKVSFVSRQEYNSVAEKNGLDPKSFGVTVLVKDKKNLQAVSFLVQGELDPLFEEMLAVHEGCHREQLIGGERGAEAPCILKEQDFLNRHFPNWWDTSQPVTETNQFGFVLPAKLPTALAVNCLLGKVGIKNPTPADRLYATGILYYKLNGPQAADRLASRDSKKIASR